MISLDVDDVWYNVTDDVCFRVVTEAREWRYFKNLSRLNTPVEEDMFGFDAKTSLPQVIPHFAAVIILNC